MFARNRVIWNEGLFIKPQHFQQQQRHTEYYIDERMNTVSRYLYGVADLTLNPEYLAFGRIAIERATGVMPDGTVFNIPQEDAMPEPLEIHGESVANQLVYLALPLRTEALMEVTWPEERGSGRYVSRRMDIRDVQSMQGDTTTINVAPRLHATDA